MGCNMVGMHPCHALVGSVEPNPLVISILATWGARNSYVLARLRSYYIDSTRLVLLSYAAKKKQHLLDTHGCHDTLASYVAS